MDTTVAVALIGAAATVATGIGGYVYNYRAGLRVHEANRELAEERHSHERELADNAQAHERQLHQGERAYEDRKATYRLVANSAFVGAEIARGAETAILTNKAPTLPPGMPDDEWARMRVEVGLFGSPEVARALSGFLDAFKSFSDQLVVVRTLRAENKPLGDSVEAMKTARREVGASYDKLATAMRDELASL